MAVRASGRDALGAAVLASILLHLLLLTALPGWRDWPKLPSPAPIAARIVPEPLRREQPVDLEQPLAVVSSAVTKRPLPSRGAASPRQSPRADTVAAPAVNAAADAGMVARYRLAIISFAKGFNRYPRVAIENDWQGRAEVSVIVGADGSIASVSLRRGSGYEILDRQALDTIGSAAPQVPLPEVLRGRGFTLDIPVIFSLQER